MIIVEMKVKRNISFFGFMILQIGITVIITHYLETGYISQGSACKYITDPQL